MGKLDPLAGPGEDHSVLADYVAAPERSKTDIALAPGPGLAVAGPHAALVERNASRSGGSRAKHQRCPRRRVALVAMMHFENLDVELWSKRLGHARGETSEQVDAEAHVARFDDGGMTGGGGDLGLVWLGEAGRANDMDNAGLRRERGKGHGRGRHGDAEGLDPRHLADVPADCW